MILERLAGQSGSIPVYRICESMIPATSFSMAVLNGKRSNPCIVSTSISRSGNSKWESRTVLPMPGKCLATAIIFSAWRWSITTFPCSDTQPGSEPNARSAMTLSMPFGATSSTGARFMLIPTSESSLAVVLAKKTASSGPFIFGLPGNCVNGSLSRATFPPSWSMEIKSGGWSQIRAYDWMEMHRFLIWPGSMRFLEKRMMPPTFISLIRNLSSGFSSVPSNPTIKRCPADCSGVNVVISMFNSHDSSLHPLEVNDQTRSRRSETGKYIPQIFTCRASNLHMSITFHAKQILIPPIPFHQPSMCTDSRFA